MIILIDYDNVPRLERQHGLAAVITKILTAIGSARLAGIASVSVRLYGGWFTGANLSRNGQRLVPEVAAHFPRTVTVTDGAGTATVIVRCELARSLLCDPASMLTHTHRQRSVPAGLTCHSVPYAGCTNPGGCPLAPVHSLIGTQQCPTAGCQVSPGEVLAREEQKLVDTMLVIDLAHLGRQGGSVLVVVSTDDDVWPGIRFALLLGAVLIHVHPIPGRSTPRQYRRLMTATYTEVSL